VIDPGRRSASGFDPGAVVANLRLLAERTGGPDGAARLAWTPIWEEARELAEEIAGEDFKAERDRAGNLWFLPRAPRGPLVVLGSHLDSVPNGGWLDGALGVLAGLEVARSLQAAASAAGLSLAVVDWADEEGARFGRSLFGSASFVGSLDPVQIEQLTDKDGARAVHVLAADGVDLGALGPPDARLAEIVAYLELHIEQGPVLERASIDTCAVSGTVGIERERLDFVGQPAHAGPTPMVGRRDAFLAAAETALALEGMALEAGGRVTTGRLELEPGVPTVVPGRASLFVDLRHGDAGELRRMRERALTTAEEAAKSRDCGVSREHIWGIEPREFDARLVALAEQACQEASGERHDAIESGALHDAAEMAAKVPTAMVFCASLRGLSHAPEEDSTDQALELSLRAFHGLASKALDAGLSS
jgi:N-carbamoyl-L-amino-acid hydrolase